MREQDNRQLLTKVNQLLGRSCLLPWLVILVVLEIALLLVLNKFSFSFKRSAGQVPVVSAVAGNTGCFGDCSATGAEQVLFFSFIREVLDKFISLITH
jgi:hypothetical protein